MLCPTHGSKCYALWNTTSKKIKSDDSDKRLSWDITRSCKITRCAGYVACLSSQTSLIRTSLKDSSQDNCFINVRLNTLLVSFTDGTDHEALTMTFTCHLEFLPHQFKAYRVRTRILQPLKAANIFSHRRTTSSKKFYATQFFKRGTRPLSEQNLGLLITAHQK